MYNKPRKQWDKSGQPIVLKLGSSDRISYHYDDSRRLDEENMLPETSEVMMRPDGNNFSFDRVNRPRKSADYELTMPKSVNKKEEKEECAKLSITELLSSPNNASNESRTLTFVNIHNVMLIDDANIFSSSLWVPCKYDSFRDSIVWDNVLLNQKNMSVILHSFENIFNNHSQPHKSLYESLFYDAHMDLCFYNCRSDVYMLFSDILKLGLYPCGSNDYLSLRTGLEAKGSECMRWTMCFKDDKTKLSYWYPPFDPCDVESPSRQAHTASASTSTSASSSTIDSSSRASKLRIFFHLSRKGCPPPAQHSSTRDPSDCDQGLGDTVTVWTIPSGGASASPPPHACLDVVQSVDGEDVSFLLLPTSRLPSLAAPTGKSRTSPYINPLVPPPSPLHPPRERGASSGGGTKEGSTILDHLRGHYLTDMTTQDQDHDHLSLSPAGLATHSNSTPPAVLSSSYASARSLSLSRAKAINEHRVRQGEVSRMVHSDCRRHAVQERYASGLRGQTGADRKERNGSQEKSTDRYSLGGDAPVSQARSSLQRRSSSTDSMYSGRSGSRPGSGSGGGGLLKEGEREEVSPLRPSNMQSHFEVAGLGSDGGGNAATSPSHHRSSSSSNSYSNSHSNASPKKSRGGASSVHALLSAGRIRDLVKGKVRSMGNGSSEDCGGGRGEGGGSTDGSAAYVGKCLTSTAKRLPSPPRPSQPQQALPLKAGGKAKAPKATPAPVVAAKSVFGGFPSACAAFQGLTHFNGVTDMKSFFNVLQLSFQSLHPLEADQARSDKSSSVELAVEGCSTAPAPSPSTSALHACDIAHIVSQDSHHILRELFHIVHHCSASVHLFYTTTVVAARSSAVSGEGSAKGSGKGRVARWDWSMSSVVLGEMEAFLSIVQLATGTLYLLLRICKEILHSFILGLDLYHYGGSGSAGTSDRSKSKSTSNGNGSGNCNAVSRCCVCCNATVPTCDGRSLHRSSTGPPSAMPANRGGALHPPSYSLLQVHVTSLQELISSACVLLHGSSVGAGRSSPTTDQHQHQEDESQQLFGNFVLDVVVERLRLMVHILVSAREGVPKHTLLRVGECSPFSSVYESLIPTYDALAHSADSSNHQHQQLYAVCASCAGHCLSSWASKDGGEDGGKDRGWEDDVFSRVAPLRYDAVWDVSSGGGLGAAADKCRTSSRLMDFLMELLRLTEWTPTSPKARSAVGNGTDGTGSRPESEAWSEVWTSEHAKRMHALQFYAVVLISTGWMECLDSSHEQAVGMQTTSRSAIADMLSPSAKSEALSASSESFLSIQQQRISHSSIAEWICACTSSDRSWLGKTSASGSSDLNDYDANSFLSAHIALYTSHLLRIFHNQIRAKNALTSNGVPASSGAWWSGLVPSSGAWWSGLVPASSWPQVEDSMLVSLLDVHACAPPPATARTPPLHMEGGRRGRKMELVSDTLTLFKAVLAGLLCGSKGHGLAGVAGAGASGVSTTSSSSLKVSSQKQDAGEVFSGLDLRKRAVSSTTSRGASGSGSGSGNGSGSGVHVPSHSYSKVLQQRVTKRGKDRATEIVLLELLSVLHHYLVYEKLFWAADGDIADSGAINGKGKEGVEPESGGETATTDHTIALSLAVVPGRQSLAAWRESVLDGLEGLLDIAGDGGGASPDKRKGSGGGAGVSPAADGAAKGKGGRASGGGGSPSTANASSVSSRSVQSPSCATPQGARSVVKAKGGEAGKGTAGGSPWSPSSLLASCDTTGGGGRRHKKGGKGGGGGRDKDYCLARDLGQCTWLERLVGLIGACYGDCPEGGQVSVSLHNSLGYGEGCYKPAPPPTSTRLSHEEQYMAVSGDRKRML